MVVVPAGTQHRFVNTGDTPLELITIFSPAKHDPQTVHKTKEEGDQEEEEGKDEAPEWSRRSKKENEEAGEVKPDGGPLFPVRLGLIWVYFERRFGGTSSTLRKCIYRRILCLDY